MIIYIIYISINIDWIFFFAQFAYESSKDNIDDPVLHWLMHLAEQWPVEEQLTRLTEFSRLKTQKKVQKRL